MHAQFYEAGATALIAALTAAYVLGRSYRGRIRRRILEVQGAIFVWTGFVAASRAGISPEIDQASALLAFVGIFWAPPAWVLLARELTVLAGTERFARGPSLLYLPSAFMLFVLVTNPWHHGFILEPGALLTAGPAEWAGLLFWPWALWGQGLVVVGSLTYLRWSLRLIGGRARLRGVMICAAAGLPLVGNVAHVLGLLSMDHDPTPMLFGGTLALLFVADWRLRLLDAVPVARRDVIEQLRDGVVVADAQGRILDMNPAAERMIGSGLATLLGQPIVRAVATHAVDRFHFDEESFNRVIVELCESKSGFDVEIENFAGRTFDVRGASVVDDGGKIVGLYMVFHDVTTKSRFDEAMTERRRAEAVANLASGIASEVGDPLAWTRANVGHVRAVLLEREHATDADGEKSDGSEDGRSRNGGPRDGGKDAELEELAHILDESLAGLDRIHAIVDRIGRFSRPPSSPRGAVALGELIDLAVRIRELGTNPAVELTVDVADGLPPVHAEPNGILQVLLHLLENAEQALETSGRRIRVIARARDEGVVIVVEDDGPGVPEALCARIFEPFFTTRDGEAGAGLGLSISVKLAAEAGGRLRCDPYMQDGARFELWLPASHAASPAGSDTGRDG